MTVEEQIKLSRQRAFFEPILVKAINMISEDILEGMQEENNRTKKMHDKLYKFALNFSRTCQVSDSIFNSCISSLLDDAQYKAPEGNPNELTEELYTIILADYGNSSVEGGISKYPSWIERIAGYELGDEEAKL